MSTRLATQRDLSYAVHLQRKFSNQIGWVPRLAYAGRIDRRDVTLCTVNDDPIGMLVAHPRRSGIAHISQAAVELDLQRSLHGAQLVADFALRSAAAGCSVITCTVRDGLPAHSFWQALGFAAVRTRPGGRARRRLLVDYAASVDDVSIATSLLLDRPRPSTLFEPDGG